MGNDVARPKRIHVPEDTRTDHLLKLLVDNVANEGLDHRLGECLVGDDSIRAATELVAEDVR